MTALHHSLRIQSQKMLETRATPNGMKFIRLLFFPHHRRITITPTPAIHLRASDTLRADCRHLLDSMHVCRLIHTLIMMIFYSYHYFNLLTVWCDDIFFAYFFLLILQTSRRCNHRNDEISLRLYCGSQINGIEQCYKCDCHKLGLCSSQ